jgi:hypothetical protein
MRLEPVNNWIIGRAIIPKVDRTIVLPDETKGVTRCYQVESASIGATIDGHKLEPGDIVVAKHAFDMFFPVMHRVTFLAAEVICFVREASASEFVDLKGNEVEPIKVAA